MGIGAVVEGVLADYSTPQKQDISDD